MIDTHAHIYSDKFSNDLDNVLERAFNEVGIEKILMPNIDHTSIDAMMKLEEDYAGRCISMMGLHPCSVNKDFEKELYIAEDWFNKRDFIAVGEMGLDLYWDKSFFEHQKEAFKIQAEWAKNKNLPLVIHTREAMAETIDLLEQINDDRLFGVLHCFTGNLDDANRLIDMGFNLGIGGVATFKNGGMDQVLPHVDMKHLVLETDSPYLAPVPHRGKRNEPSYVDLVARRVAELKGLEVEEVKVETTENAKALFKLS